MILGSFASSAFIDSFAINTVWLSAHQAKKCLVLATPFVYPVKSKPFDKKHEKNQPAVVVTLWSPH